MSSLLRRHRHPGSSWWVLHPLVSEIFLMYPTLLVVWCIHCLANLFDMGRNLRARDDTPWFVEFDKCPIVLREA
jgi:hypothetical protein